MLDFRVCFGYEGTTLSSTQDHYLKLATLQTYLDSRPSLSLLRVPLHPRPCFIISRPVWFITPEG